MDEIPTNILEMVGAMFSHKKDPRKKEHVELALNESMIIEQEKFIGAGHYERAGEKRNGYKNGYQPRRINTAVGTLDIKVPRTAKQNGTPFYPKSLLRGQRNSEELQEAVATAYFQGTSARSVGKIFECLGIESLSTYQVTEAVKKFDAAFKAWRERQLGEFTYLILDARYEKQRQNGKVVSVAVLSAIGVERDGNQRVLGLTIAPSETKNCWKEFLENLTRRGLNGVEFIVSDDHTGLNAARRAVFPNAKWQRCQFHLTQNAKKHCPNTQIKKGIAKELRTVYDAENLEQAEAALDDLVAKYSTSAPKLAVWLENNVPEALSVFSLPKEHQVRMRTSNLIERAINQEIKQRTRKVRVFPNEQSLLRLATSVVFRIDKKWLENKSIFKICKK